MSRMPRPDSIRPLFLACAIASTAATGALAIVDDHPAGRFDHLALSRSGGAIGITARPLASLSGEDALRLEWERLTARPAGVRRVWIDERSALPTLATLQDVEWVEAQTADLDRLAELARGYLDDHRSVLGNWEDQIVLDREASGRRGSAAMMVRFGQVVGGVPVEGAHYDFHVAHGKLISLGARRWAPVSTSTQPSLEAAEARRKLDAYVRAGDGDGITDLDAPQLLLVPVNPDPASNRSWKGVRGAGYAHRLIWRFRFTDIDGIATWTGEVDAHSGEIIAFYDDTHYDRVKGHVNPISDDGACYTGGCPEPGFPLPYVGYTVDGGAVQYADQTGHYECSTIGQAIGTSLQSPHVVIEDQCGGIAETTTCADEMDLGANIDVNCGVAPGSSPGNTDGARSAYYSLSNVSRKARFWTSGIAWLDDPVVCRTNVDSTCNATWGGNRINMYRAGNGCGNTAQIQGVVVHEWGHGFDENDNGGFDNPSEAYADVVAIFEARESCMGRGFKVAQTCSGYGDECLTCTGIRDMDWDAREAHTPATPTGFLSSFCNRGGGPCGKEVHCASYVPSEAIFDLATRDLPAMGLDADTAWQLAERLWYQSRPGSGGDTYNCTLPDSDSCSVGTWYHQLRVQDDDDGDLTNGTPHAAAIFAAFDRHDIACGSAGDAENQNSSSCSALETPSVTFAAQTNAVSVSWDPVSGAAAYRVYRNELGCNRAQFPLAEVDAATTGYLDDGLINGFPVYYRVQAIGSNAACESPVSTCLEAAAQALAGEVAFDRATYGCSHAVGLTVTDANHPTTTMTVSIWSDSEPTPETVVLTETPPASARFVGSIQTTPSAATADGMLSIANGDLIVAQYVDLDDGEGGADVATQSTALGDCRPPILSAIGESAVEDDRATIVWLSDEPATSGVTYGTSVPPMNDVEAFDLVGEHGMMLHSLDACTGYYYSVRSTDAAGNQVEDDNNGAYHRFETYINIGAGPQPCHQGRVTIPTPAVGCGASVPLQVGDRDLDTDPGTVEIVTVTVSSWTEPTAETVALIETGPATGIFTGSIPTAEGAAASGDGVLQVTTGDAITAVYNDDDDGTGNPNVTSDTTMANCDAPGYVDVSVVGITADSAVINWTTSEPTTGYVDWGPSAALGRLSAVQPMALSHSVTIDPLDECGRFYFRLVSTDLEGNSAVGDAAGSPYEFNAGSFGGVLYRDGFETVTGWSLEGEWEIGQPLGLGTHPSDPYQAYVGTGVLGHDLSGTGAFPGDYEPDTTESAISPSIDASGTGNVELRFQRWLNVANGGVGYVEVRADGGGWQQVWASPNFGGHDDDSWLEQNFDISAWTAGSSDVQIRFRQGNFLAGVYDAGWNVDQFMVRNADQPLYGTCGDCGGAPGFGGLISADDDEPCADSGITLQWQGAVAWGTGTGGSYAVYRETTLGFTPSPANLLASGITGSTWTDPAPPAGITLYYAVRAENNESCSEGPNNGGVLDDNMVRVAVMNQTDQSLPGDVGPTLLVDGVNEMNVRLTWGAAPGAAGYSVYRSSVADGGFNSIAQPVNPLHEDIGALNDLQDWYYLVLSANACGNESGD